MVNLRRLAGGLPFFLAVSCREPLPDDFSLVSGPRILAVRGDPPEAKPGAQVSFTALYVDADGSFDERPLDWAFCNDRKPLSELGPVAESCLARTGMGILPIADASVAMGALPMDACRRFGPDLPDPVNGQPAGRPVDPDGTGGYYQPLRIYAPGVSTPILAEQRIACGIADAPAHVAADFGKRYIMNASPEVERASVKGTAGEVDLDENAAAPIRVASLGESISFTVRWPACPTDVGTPCNGAEAYLTYDPASQKLVVRHEGIRVSWFATAGRFAIGHTGRTEAEAALTDSSNTWTAPPAAGTGAVFVVLRDDRGGVAWRRYPIAWNESEVRP